MDKNIKILRWIYSINKRLFLKKSFIFLLMFVPVLCFFLSFGIKERSHILKIGLYKEAAYDRISDDIINKLISSDSAIKFYNEADKDKAVKKLSDKKLDALICFPDDIKEAVNSHIIRNTPILEITEADKNVALSLVREKLYMALFPYISESFYYDFMENRFGVSEKNIAEGYYNAVSTPDDFVKISFIDDASSTGNTSYIAAVMRGILSVWITVCGIAAGIYYLDDRKSGIFIWLGQGRQMLLSVFYLICPLILCGLVMLSAIFMLKINKVSLLNELISLLLLILSTAAFSGLLMNILNSSEALIGLIPILSFGLLFITPIFIDIGIRPLQYIFPSFYYLQLSETGSHCIRFIIYIMVLVFLNIILKAFSSMREKF